VSSHPRCSPWVAPDSRGALILLGIRRRRAGSAT
jgi:hypothetical protein